MYYRIGQLMAMALVHGGAAVHLISSSVYNFLMGMRPCDIIVGLHEIPDASIRDMCQKAKYITSIIILMVTNSGNT